MSTTAAAILGGIELVKFLIILALQEAARAKMTPEQIEETLSQARTEFALSNPNQIPDV